MQTFRRGFFCSDLSLRYPYHEGTISVPILLTCMLLLPILFICIVEIMRICKRFRTRVYMLNLWQSLATFSFGFIATYLTTELAKNVIGRLRPHFYDACQPRLLDGSSCEELLHPLHHAHRTHEAITADIYVQNYYCSNRNLSTRQLDELHVSFPSAHASLSFYSMIFLAFYIHAIWRGRGLFRVLRHILQFVLIMFSWYIALSRVADYWHHWSDVLIGALLGLTYGIITAVYVGEFVQFKNYNETPKQQQQQLQQSIIIPIGNKDAREEQLICKHMDDDMKISESV